jgi:hypothetical protein
MNTIPQASHEDGPSCEEHRAYYGGFAAGAFAGAFTVGWVWLVVTFC